MTLTYYDHLSVKAYHITNLVTSAIWTTKHQGSPSVLTVSLLDADNVTWNLGGILALEDDDAQRFYGYIFDITATKDGIVTLVAYDQLRYLKNKDTYVFAYQRADQIIAQICDDFQLQVGTLPSTGYVIPSLVEDNVTLFDICLQALEETLTNTGKRYFLWDDYGTLRLTEVAVPDALLVLGEDSLATDFTYQTSIDESTYNRIAILQNSTSGGRTKVVREDTANQALWGILQLTQSVNQSATDLTTLASSLLTLYNQPTTTLTIQALAQPGLRAGTLLLVELDSLGISQLCLVEECTHQLHNKTMTLKVRAYTC